jgi:hypothetical protein
VQEGEIVTKEITLTISEAVFRKAEQVAQAEGRPIEEILEEQIQWALPNFDVNPDRAAMQQEAVAFEKLHANLWKQYPNQYVAVYQGKVVDHDKNIAEMVARLRRDYPNQTVLIRRVQPQLPKPLWIPSIRWAVEG